ncbi:NAD-dependent epimerase/dehydratase family protein [Tomitella biformata]|uniref:NAD-dependent epimerase/dehydratase family protein n=1 Tax=Tomitella biformata TaxID=630403 RepID=UPI000463955A|nr:NAD-dependent epimerase/dehydratase family protein [Tomitella biformata]
MKVAVTGAAGFVGSNLVDLLVEQGHDVVAIDRIAAEHWPTHGVTFIEGNVLDPAAMEAALEGVDIAYHMVAMITLKQQDETAWNLNTKGVRIVAEAALKMGVRRLVHCSSVHSFDQYSCGGFLNEASRRSESPEIPVYDRSKWAGEQELQKVIAKGLDAVICNPTGVYGPTDFGALSRINGMLRDSARGRIPAVVTGGFDLVDVRDVVIGLTLAAEKGRTGENYLLTGHMLNMKWVFNMAAKITGRRGPIVAFPLSWIVAILPVAEPIAAKFGSDLVSKAAMGALIAQPEVDGSKASSELGYQPRRAAETIQDLITFLISSRQFAG